MSENTIQMWKPATAKPWKIERHQLLCNLDDVELLARAHDLVTAMKDVSDKDQAAKALKDQVKDLNEKIATLQQATLYKQELREVDCELIPDFDRSTLTTYRLDTGAYVTRRVLEFSEREQDLPMDEAKPVLPIPADGLPTITSTVTRRCSECASFEKERCAEKEVDSTAPACDEFQAKDEPATENHKGTVSPAICGDCASFDTGDCASQEDDSHESACASFIGKPATVEVAAPKGGKKAKKTT